MVPRILYVEDNEDLRSVTTQILIKAGYSVTPTANGMEALALFDPAKFDLVITDISMPEMDGNKLIARLESNPTLPPILVLAYTQDEIGPSRVISITGLKPLTSRNLLLLVSNAFQIGGRKIKHPPKI